jgi:hypothetical protein
MYSSWTYSYVWLYNHHLLQNALNHETLIQALKRWQSTHPEPFVKQVCDRPGSDTYREYSDDQPCRGIHLR